MTTLYVHHGYNKTGTTALQNFFRSNRAALIKHGVLYPSFGTENISAHHILIAPFCRRPQIFASDETVESIIRRVKTEMQESGASTVLISSEMMTFYKDYYPERIQQLLAEFDQVRLISYVRRQDEYAYSYYNSAIRNGRCATDFKTFVQSINFDYFDNLTQKESLYGAGNVTVRVYDRERFAGESIIADFLSILGLQLTSDFVVSPERPNEALSKPMVYLLRELNGMQLHAHADFVRYLRNFVQQQTDLPPAPEYFSRQERIEMLAAYRESNQRLSEHFLDGTPLFNEQVPDNIGPVGSYDTEVKILLARLVAAGWNEKIESSAAPAGFLPRLRARLRRLL